MSIGPAERLSALPPYLFAEIDRKRRAAVAAGKDVIDLGVGDPDRPTPEFIVKRMLEAVPVPSNHHYAFGEGMPEFNRAAAEWLRGRFGVELDPRSEVLTLIGTKEGIGHLPLATINPGDTVLVPQPGYPVYTSAAIFAAAEVHVMPLRPETGWLPALEEIPEEVVRRARLMYLNYPNNPTAATCDQRFYESVVEFAARHDLLVAQDAAYSEVYFEARPPSILQVRGAKEHCVEFHSLSKTFNMTGWRLGFAAGNAAALAALAAVKNNVDSGQFMAVQWAGVQALSQHDHVSVKAQLDIYRERRDVLVEGLRGSGMSVERPRATFYVWARCPDGYDSLTFAARALEEANVVVVPGIGFGQPGEGYFRAALTLPADRLKEAAARLAEVNW